MAMAIGDLQRYAVAFVVIGVVLTVGLAILGGVNEELTVSEYNNETVNLTTGDTYTTSVASGSDFVELTSVTCYDSSSKTTEYTCSIYNATEGQIQADDSSFDSANNEFIEYDYEVEDQDARKGTGQAMEGLTTFTGWLPLIALVVVAAIIIALVMRFGGAATGGKQRARA